MEIILKSDNLSAVKEIIEFAKQKGAETQINNLCLKSIDEILKLQEPFLVDSYQRGYKWTEQQVTDLLQDIYAFDPTKNTFYCLQPIVVKFKNIENSQNAVWELIDGQQRMTTIYLILSYLEKNKCKINYKTREGSADFLKKINEASVFKDFNDYIKNKSMKDNIDNYYFFKAFKTIQKWFEDGKNKKNKFYENLTKYTQVIWYQIDNEIDSREIFTRLNSGKIPLTNAELVKALFLQNSGNNKLNQTEIAKEWDAIEQSLQNDSFWFFLNDKKNQTPTRIDFIFDLITKKGNNTDAYFSFRELTKEKKLESIWQEVKVTYATLQEWFEDKELYHYVGFLLHFGEKPIKLITESKNIPKSRFKSDLIHSIKKHIDIEEDKLEELEYGENSSKIRKILLLFNVETVLKSKNTQMYFDFNAYKSGSWDIEHIHAIASKMPNNTKEQDEWLKDSLDFLNPNEKKEVEKEPSFEAKYLKILEYCKYEDINDISNLTLLDSKTNRKYKNAIFPVKRQTIITEDKKGTFILPCTKHLFLKYYTKSGNLKNSFWNAHDRNNYVQAIKKTLKKFFTNSK